MGWLQRLDEIPCARCLAHRRCSAYLPVLVVGADPGNSPSTGTTLVCSLQAGKGIFSQFSVGLSRLRGETPSYQEWEPGSGSGPPSAPSRPHTHGIDLDVDSENGVGPRGVLIHQGVANGTVLPASLHDAFALGHIVYGVHGQPLDIHSLLGMLLQLQGGPGKVEITKGRTLSRPLVTS